MAEVLGVELSSVTTNHDLIGFNFQPPGFVSNVPQFPLQVTDAGLRDAYVQIR